MKKLFLPLYGILFFSLSSCQQEIDKTDPFKLGHLMHKSLMENDSTVLRQLFIYEMDSLNEFSIANLKQAKEFLTSNPSLKISKIDTSSFISSWNHLGFIDIIYKHGKDWYQMRSSYEPDTTGTIDVRMFSFNHINKQCEEYTNTPYQPTHLMDFNRIMWVTDYSGKTLESGAVEIQNKTELDIEYVKFRIILKNKEGFSTNIFFNQTIESYGKIYKGDMAKIDIPGMENYYVGFPVKKNNLRWESELIEVRPKPEYFWCNKLKDLESEVLEQT